MPELMLVRPARMANRKLVKTSAKRSVPVGEGNIPLVKKNQSNALKHLRMLPVECFLSNALKKFTDACIAPGTSCPGLPGGRDSAIPTGPEGARSAVRRPQGTAQKARRCDSAIPRNSARFRKNPDVVKNHRSKLRAIPRFRVFLCPQKTIRWRRSVTGPRHIKRNAFWQNPRPP